MLDTIIKHLQHTHAGHLLAAVTDLSDLTYKATNTSISYMKIIRKISKCLKGVDIIQLMPFFAITKLDQERYPGLMSCYLADDPALVYANILYLGQMLATQEKRHNFLNCNSGSSGQISSTQCAAASSDPCPSPSPEPAPRHIDSSFYPPSKGVAWKFKQQMVEAEASCPGCHFHGDAAKQEFHQEVGCPTLPKKSYVCHKDTSAAEVITALHS